MLLSQSAAFTRAYVAHSLNWVTLVLGPNPNSCLLCRCCCCDPLSKAQHKSRVKRVHKVDANVARFVVAARLSINGNVMRQRSPPHTHTYKHTTRSRTQTPTRRRHQRLSVIALSHSLTLSLWLSNQAFLLLFTTRFWLCVLHACRLSHTLQTYVSLLRLLVRVCVRGLVFVCGSFWHFICCRCRRFASFVCLLACFTVRIVRSLKKKQIEKINL